MDAQTIADACKNNSITISNNQALKILDIIDHILKINETHNLTSITNPEEMLYKHIIDSLELTKVIDVSQYETVYDIGSGAGFPGLILSILNPGTVFVLFESNKKKATFLQDTAKQFSLANVLIVNDRIENTTDKYRYAKLITARAVSGISETLELSCRALQMNGLFVYYSSQKQATEFNNNRSIKELGFKIEKIHNYELPANTGSHSLIIVKKLWKTAKGYPRSFSKIKNNPL